MRRLTLPALLAIIFGTGCVATPAWWWAPPAPAPAPTPAVVVDDEPETRWIHRGGQWREIPAAEYPTITPEPPPVTYPTVGH